jgi:hypothetical protein
MSRGSSGASGTIITSRRCVRKNKVKKAQLCRLPQSHFILYITTIPFHTLYYHNPTSYSILPALHFFNLTDRFPHNTLHTPHSTLNMIFHTPHSTLNMTFHAPHSTLHSTLHSTQHTTHNTQHTTHNTQHTTHNTQHTPSHTVLFTLRFFHSTSHTPKSTLQNPHSKVHTPKSTLQNPHSKVHTSKSTLQNPHSKIHTPKSTLQNPHYKIHTPKSTLRTPTFHNQSTPSHPSIPTQANLEAVDPVSEKEDLNVEHRYLPLYFPEGRDPATGRFVVQPKVRSTAKQTVVDGIDVRRRKLTDSLTDLLTY